MKPTGSEVVDRMLRATNEHDLDGMVRSFREDYRSEQPLHPEAGFGGREQVRKNWGQMFDEVPDLRCEIVRATTSNDEVWTELRVHGNKRDGSAFEYRGMVVWGVHDDLIAWARLYFEPVEAGGPGIDDRMRHVLGKEL